MCCPAPVQSRFRAEVAERLAELVRGLGPTTRAYHEIWLDGELACSSEPASDPLYGQSYLPRKFKTAVAIEGDNCVDIYANDLGLVARGDGSGGLAGFDVLVGGGLGRTNRKPDTFAAVARPLTFVVADQVLQLSRTVISIHRDFGSRTDRRHARLKYVIAEHGLDWFRERVQERLDFKLQPPRPLRWQPVDDHLGWHEQGEGNWYLGVHLENGRIADHGAVQLRTGLREVVARFGPELRLTPQQNIILTGLRAEDRRELEAILARNGIPLAESLPRVIRNALACPALPTCGLAVAEAERVMPGLIRRLADLVEGLGLGNERISFRMTGCPNGCARPYIGDVGFVGTTLGKYDVFLGGDFDGTRLNQLYAESVPLEEIPQILEGPLSAFSHERSPGQGFGDWCALVGLETLGTRFGVGPVRAIPPTSVPPSPEQRASAAFSSRGKLPSTGSGSDLPSSGAEAGRPGTAAGDLDSRAARDTSTVEAGG